MPKSSPFTGELFCWDFGCCYVVSLNITDFLPIEKEKQIMKTKQKITSLLLAFCVVASCITAAFAATVDECRAAMEDTAAYLLKTVANPQVGSTGGEWAVIGLARSGYDVPQKYFDTYYANVEKTVAEAQGVLHERKYTEYSRVILALTAIGKDPSNVGGYNLLEKLGDFDKTVWQGINGPIFALLALDCGGYDIPVNKDAKTQATRELYIQEILEQQLDDGGFALNGTTADPDVTGMALQALSRYREQEAVNAAVDKALVCLSTLQDETGGYQSWGTKNTESTAQVLTALGELGIRADDSRFTKNGMTLLDSLLGFYEKGSGFSHAESGGDTGMASEQGLYALASYLRFADGKTSLYDMSDVKKAASAKPEELPAVGLPGKHADINPVPVVTEGKTFADIAEHKSRQAIESLASRDIINGMTEDVFSPDSTMTRAQFAAITTRALGLAPKTNAVFSDIAADSWYAAYIGTAYSYGIIKGTSDTTFTPEATITREEAAVMVARAANLCGMETTMGEQETLDMLAQFSDYTKSADWAREALAFCYKNNILPQDAIDILPKAEITRAEVAEMLCQMLKQSKLL